jgi:hypothetical protein
VHQFQALARPRELSVAERSYLEFLLSRPFQGSAQLQEQLNSAKVSEECGSGCGSIGLVVDPCSSTIARVRRRIPIEAQGLDVDGVPVHFLLHVVDGFLAELEIFREDPDPVIQLPSVDLLALFSLDDFA